MSDQTSPAMDYAEHERTYTGFLNFSKVAIVAAINVMICLLLLTFGGGGAAFFGTVLMIATLIAAGVGLFAGANGWVPSAVITLVSGLLAIITLA
ncbi:aa3-type cytochrome c oxidase subunit IV [Stappia sp. ES.058]|uniref:aa3-type cytochrome c oxidase subunit IV n=1 Tax=Stappia sp. ES.058 TaxID=1881061 RepID=UPI00087CBD18|nr:aa3-type cytochrome c oxidase subunit IV [Stappia sp. ES.058]SDU35693.1 aa3 type cytochrome c oxidase subunit IV [Stappia sp. ES.058]